MTLRLLLGKGSVFSTLGDAEYLRNCNAAIFTKWICQNISEVMLDVGISLKYQCWNISEVPLLEYLRNYLVCRNISEVDNAG